LQPTKNAASYPKPIYGEDFARSLSGVIQHSRQKARKRQNPKRSHRTMNSIVSYGTFVLVKERVQQQAHLSVDRCQIRCYNRLRTVAQAVVSFLDLA
jgi:hypothetical protein